MGGAFFGAVFIQSAAVGWLVTAGPIFWKLLQQPWQTDWQPPAWIKCLFCGVVAALGDTVAAILLGFAAVYLVFFTLGIAGSRGLGIAIVPLLLLLGTAAMIVVCRKSKPSP